MPSTFFPKLAVLWRRWWPRLGQNGHFASAYLGSKPTVSQLQRILKRQIELQDTIYQIRRILGVKQLCDAVPKALRYFFHADRVLLVQAAAAGWHLAGSAGQTPLKIDSHCLDKILRQCRMAAHLSHRRPLCIDATVASRVPTFEPWLRTFKGSWLLIAVYLPRGLSRTESRDMFWGLVAVGHRQRPWLWSREEQQHLSTLCSDIGVAMHHSLSYEKLLQTSSKLESLALTDSLTGLANRRQFDNYFRTEWQRLTREQQPLTLILCDIDYFKQYNDCYGHPAGDSCLIRVSQILQGCTRRPADLVARYGGEEFVVVLPNTDTGGGHNIALKIQEKMKLSHISHGASETADYVTLTMGIATIVPSTHKSYHKLLQAADLALYYAKQHGRDRIYTHAHYYLYRGGNKEKERLVRESIADLPASGEEISG